MLVHLGKGHLIFQGCFKAREIEDKGQRGCWFKEANITEISGNAISLALSITLLRQMMLRETE